jgi:hypothetical protein
MIGPVLQFHDLQEICKPGEKPRLATVESWIRKLGIVYQYDGNGGLWTTVNAIEVALGVVKASNEPMHYEARNLF